MAMIVPDTKLYTPAKTEILPLPEFPLDNNAHPASPPPYASSDYTSSSSVPTFILPSIQPVNYISLNEVKRSARGTFVLDASLAIPSEFLPPLPEGELENNRSNLNVKSQNGHTSAEVFLLNRPIIEPRKKVILNTSSSKGSVWNIIHREGSSPSPPFHLTSSSENGNVSVKLPRSFRGSVITSTTRKGHVRMSDAVFQVCTGSCAKHRGRNPAGIYWGFTPSARRK